MEHILLGTNIETSKLRIVLTLNAKKFKKSFEDGINEKNEDFMNVQRLKVSCKLHRLLKLCALIKINLHFPLPKYIISPILLLNVYTHYN